MKSVFEDPDKKLQNPQIAAIVTKAIAVMKEKRLAQGHSQNELSRQAHVQPKVVHHFEKGKDFNFTTFAKFCVAMGVEPTIILKQVRKPKQNRL